MIPGMNLLAVAFGAIDQQSGLWVRFVENGQNNQGQDIPVYAEPVAVTGSFQTTDARTIQAMGLDLTSKYRTFYTMSPIAVTERGTSPDLVIFYGRKYQTVGELDWTNQDGWKGVVLQDVGPA